MAVPEMGRETPCSDCPWRRKSIPGYLGVDNAAHFYWASVTAGIEMPCHKQIEYTDELWRQTQLPYVDLCAGNLIYLRNHLKRPRSDKMIDATEMVEKSDAVFQWAHEFIAHHMPGATEAEVKQAINAATSYPDPDSYLHHE